MIGTAQIKQGLSDPHFAAKQLNRRFAKYVVKKIRPPADFFAEDWDNLLVLDACRYDLVTDIDVGSGTLNSKRSPGSNSEEFLQKHVHDRLLNDVVWVTANPWVSKYRDSIFEVIDVWDSGWDDDLQTVPPETMYQEALKAAETYPDKRLVVHFMQPHYPFIGDFGRSQLPAHRTFTGGGVRSDDSDEPSIWDLLEAGVVSKADVWKAYVENLQVVFPHARQLAEELEGLSVITADHGNELGGRAVPIPIRLYGHPSKLRTKNLVKVPWIVYDSSDRKEITSGDISTGSATDGDDVIEERLRALGYHE